MMFKVAMFFSVLGLSVLVILEAGYFTVLSFMFVLVLLIKIIDRIHDIEEGLR